MKLDTDQRLEIADILAETLADVALRLRHQLSRARRTRRDPAEAERRIERTKALANQALAQSISTGCTLEEAAARIAATSLVPAETVLYHAKRAARDKRTHDRKVRNLEIVRLAGRGWTNARIGAQFGLHPKTVTTIVQRQIRENPPCAPQS